MPTRDNGLRTLILAGILTALAMALSLIDVAVSSLLAFLPGFKLGLANIVSLFALYTMGLPWALGICAARCVLTAFYSGQLTMFLFSILGGVGSVLLMAGLQRCLSVLKVSMSGGVAHNLLQLLAAALITSTPGIGSYLPVLIALGTATGFLTGWLCAEVLRRVTFLPSP